MPRPYGTDHLKDGAEGTHRLLCHVPKEWVARRPGTRTSAEHPGTAVHWDGELYEVVAARGVGALVEYTLGPWDDRHAVRSPAVYDAESEKTATEKRRREARETAGHDLAILFGVVTGLLPTHVQERLEREWNVPGDRMTILSALTLAASGVFGALDLFSRGQGHALTGVPAWIWLLCIALLPESKIRFSTAMAQGKPVGSMLVGLPWAIVSSIHRALRGKRADDPPEIVVPGDQELDAYDGFQMREPLLSLLSPGEQRLLEKRFGFEPLLWGKLTAAMLLVLSVAMVWRAVGFVAEGKGTELEVFLVPLFVAIGGEQVPRLLALRAGRIKGSFLGALVRPFSAGVLAAARRPAPEFEEPATPPPSPSEAESPDAL